MINAFPFPIGGWNAKNSIDDMPIQDAIILRNVLPDGTRGRLRPGYSVHSTNNSSSPVESLFEYAPAQGNKQLIACAGGKIYNSTGSGSSPTQLGTGFIVNRWQGVQMNNNFILCNGTDQPKKWDGATLTDAVYTGIADDSVFIQVTNYRQRLYFVQKDSTKIWYTGSSAITGAVTELDLQDLFRFGGYVMAVASASIDSRNGYNDQLLIISSEGEVLVFQGAYPGDPDWTIVSRTKIPPPIGRRCVFYALGEMSLVTLNGIVPFSLIMQGNDRQEAADLVTDKIQEAYLRYSQSYSGNNGWEVVVIPQLGWLFLNIPIVQNSTAEQIVFVRQNKAWCQFTGVNAACWVLFDNVPYFGGSNGIIYEYGDALDDNGQYIDAEIQTAYNYFDRPDANKVINLMRMMIEASEEVVFTTGINVDFVTNPLVDTVTFEGGSGSQWDVSVWDSASWAGALNYQSNWYVTKGMGKAVSLRIKGSYKNTTWKISSFLVNYTLGGIL